MTIMKLRKDLVLRKVGEDYIIVDPSQDVVDMSKVYTFNPTAAWLWEELIEKEFSKGDIIELLLSNFEIGKDQAEKDVNAFLELCEKEGLLDK